MFPRKESEAWERLYNKQLEVNKELLDACKEVKEYIESIYNIDNKGTECYFVFKNLIQAINKAEGRE